MSMPHDMNMEFQQDESTHTFQSRASLALKRWSFTTLAQEEGREL